MIIHGGELDAIAGKLYPYAFLELTSADASLFTRVNANKYRLPNAGAKTASADYAGVWCNVCKRETGTTNDDRCFIRSDGIIQLNFTTAYNSIADMLADIGTIQLAYPLATPTEISVDSVNWQSKYADNNLYCDTGDTEVEYRADIALALGQ